MTFNMEDFLTESRVLLQQKKEHEEKYGEQRALCPSLPSRPAIPDALVQITIVTECWGCGTKYARPNRTLSLRYGSQTVRVRKWHQSYGNLPREVLELEEKAPVCQSCFLEREFDFFEEVLEGEG